MDYSDIIKTAWPKPEKTGRMLLKQRAKIFLPFAALTGYDTALEEKRIVYVTKPHLESDQIHQINEALVNLENALLENQECFVKITYFVPRNSKDVSDSETGLIESVAGKVTRFYKGSNFLESCLHLQPQSCKTAADTEEKIIHFNQICRISFL